MFLVAIVRLRACFHFQLYSVDKNSKFIGSCWDSNPDYYHVDRVLTLDHKSVDKNNLKIIIFLQ